MDLTDRAYTALNDLRNALPDLAEHLEPGTPRRWTQRDLTPDQQGRQDALAVAEREAKEINLAAGIKALGNGKAPLRLDVLDATVHILGAVTELESAVCDRLGLTPLAGADTAQQIGRLVGLLDRIAALPDLAEHVHAEAVRLSRHASQVLGDTEPIHRLDARCHVCDSRSLRALMHREVVICVNRECRCEDETCGCHADPSRRHVWPYSQWSWLADVLAEDMGIAS